MPRVKVIEKVCRYDWEAERVVKNVNGEIPVLVGPLRIFAETAYV